MTEGPLDAHDQAFIDTAWETYKTSKPLTPSQIVYAYLWRSKTGDYLVNRARRVLLETLTKEEQRDAIAWVLVAVGPMTDAEMVAADMRAGVAGGFRVSKHVSRETSS